MLVGNTWVKDMNYLKKNHEGNNSQSDNSRVRSLKTANHMEAIKAVGLIKLNSKFKKVTCCMGMIAKRYEDYLIKD